MNQLVTLAVEQQHRHRAEFRPPRPLADQRQRDVAGVPDAAVLADPDATPADVALSATGVRVRRPR